MGLQASQLTASDIEDMRVICEVVNEVGATIGADGSLEDMPSAAASRASHQPMGRLTGSHYRLVRQIVTELADPPDSAFQRTGLVRAIQRTDGRHIAWVLESDRETFEEHGLDCLHEDARSLFE